jgi:hypothetical protein
MKYYVSIILVLFTCLTCYPQKEIKKNGQKINKIDEQNKKQGSWFYFDQVGNLELSCYYKNDSIVTPIVFYKNNDSIFVRYQKVDDSEIFLLKSEKKWIVGTIKTIRADSTNIDILGRYVKIGKEEFDIQEDSLLSQSATLKKVIEYWSNKAIQPIYLFGTEPLKEFYFRQFNSSKIIFNKRIVIELTLNESGLIEKVQFPWKLNNLNGTEESELRYMFSHMERWQPYFSKNCTSRYTVQLTIGSSIKN